MKARQLIQQYLRETEDPVDKMHHCKSCGATFPGSQIVKADKKEYCPSCHSTLIELDPNLYPKKPKGEDYEGFKKLSKEVGSPALAAWIGRKKYGKGKFQKMAQAGKK